MSSFRSRQRFPSSSTLLMVSAYVALVLFAVWGIIGFIASP
ncbi:MAG: hypothetical protein ACREOS_04815 [Candidatus Dormibacteraceae bacterium]